MAKTKSRRAFERSPIGKILTSPLLDLNDNNRPLFTGNLNDPESLAYLVDHVIPNPLPDGFLEDVNRKCRGTTPLLVTDMRRAELARLYLQANCNDEELRVDDTDYQDTTDYRKEFILETLALAFDLGYTRQTAFMMGLHPRLGADSKLQSLSHYPEVVDIIARMGMEISPLATRLFKPPSPAQE
jgi:hypothetical protein